MICECGAEIFFAQTVNGKKMPLNSEADPKGNVVLTQTALGLVARVVKAGTIPHEKRYMPHHATCPSAATFRRKS